MRTARLIAAAAVAIGGFGMIGCQSDPDTRHAEAGSYDSQRVNDRVPSGSPSTGAGVGTTGSATVNSADARPASGVPGTTNGASGRNDAINAPRPVGPTADPATSAPQPPSATETRDGSGLTGTGADRSTGTERRVPNLEPGDRGGPPAGGGIRGSGGAGLNGDNIKRGTGGGGGTDPRQ